MFFFTCITRSIEDDSDEENHETGVRGRKRKNAIKKQTYTHMQNHFKITEVITVIFCVWTQTEKNIAEK